jgi:hypothetical protein
MFHTTSMAFKVALVGAAVAGVFSFELNATVLKGWRISGSSPAEYEAGIDASAVYNGHSSAYLKSKNPAVDGFGTLMQDFSADKYAGKRLRLSANVKTEGAGSWAGLWMRVDKKSTSVAFDNMQDRPITGTTGWQNYAVVLNIPQDATGVFFGVLLSGPGTVWLNSVKVEVVASDVPTTGVSVPFESRRDEPINLAFTE